ncbi:OB-fold domain-containing protein [Sporosarcina sp. GW1-11]|uniref:Zn-ribbon domain-containing OB-fold protein n=1 Tax=Sporosarcina sp. GW1-11 TaxID=2899126 RepID=UPI00294E45A7|nr:OB-fold domain-containing protein [Sporosarcina sp. GW1-11]MDV6377087.1 OB-fold domain-containing protein [Sporosarcina sp. GW1-11]
MKHVTTAYQKPIPLKDQDNQPYWDAADKHQLALQKCDDCQAYAHPPGPSCAKCGSENVSWENFGDDIQATVYSYVVSYRPFLPGFQNELPTIIALAQLDDVPEVKIMGNILHCEEKELKIGLPIQMTWVDITEDRALPQWVPVTN